jgi:hypothetical protein
MCITLIITMTPLPVSAGVSTRMTSWQAILDARTPMQHALAFLDGQLWLWVMVGEYQHHPGCPLMIERLVLQK